MDYENNQPPVTGEPRVDEALRGLADFADLDVAEHPARYDAVHDVLRDVLNSPVQPPPSGESAAASPA